jgi:hypothetical protein
VLGKKISIRKKKMLLTKEKPQGWPEFDQLPKKLGFVEEDGKNLLYLDDLRYASLRSKAYFRMYFPEIKELLEANYPNFTGAILSYQTIQTSYNYTREEPYWANSYSLIRLKNGKLHNGKEPAFIALDPNYRSGEIIRPRSYSSKYDGPATKAILYALDGTIVSPTIWKKNVESGDAENITQEDRGKRLQFTGHIILGEEIEAYGHERLLWVRNGDELYVLDIVDRDTNHQTKIIERKIRAMRITKDKMEKLVFEKRSRELEEFFIDNAQFVLKSITPH